MEDFYGSLVPHVLGLLFQDRNPSVRQGPNWLQVVTVPELDILVPI